VIAESQITGTSTPTESNSSDPNTTGAGRNSEPETEAIAPVEPQPSLSRRGDSSSESIATGNSSHSQGSGSAVDGSLGRPLPDPTPATPSPTPPEPTETVSDNRGSDGVMLEPKWKQYSGYAVTLGLSSVLITLTVAWAFLSSHSSVTIFSDPQVSIVLLTFLSTMSSLLVMQCVNGACNTLRWYLAIRPSGVGLATFLSLGPTTGYLGVLRLIFSKQGVGHRRWAAQRLPLGLRNLT